MATQTVTPPPGFKLDSPEAITLPPGFVLDGAGTPSIADKIAKIKAGLATQTQYPSAQELAASPTNTSSTGPISIEMLKGAGKQIAGDALGLISRIAPNKTLSLPGLANATLNTGTPAEVSGAMAPTNAAQTAGKYLGLGAEYAAPGALAGAAGLKIPATGNALLDFVAKPVAEAGSAAGVTALRGGSDEDIAHSALAAGITTGIVQAAIKAMPAMAAKVEQIAVKPSKTDLENGFKAENVFKYDLGGTLPQTIQKAQDKLNGLTGMLRKVLGANPQADVDLVNVYGKTLADFTNNKQADAALSKILDHIEFDLNAKGISLGTGKLNLADANVAKQAVGDLGAWVNGYKDADARILEEVANKFYSNIRSSIETSAGQQGPAIAAINKSIGEIIPIKQAVIRRIPVAQRNEVIPLKAFVGLVTGNTRGVALAGADILAKSALGAQGLNALGNMPGLAPLSGRIAGATGGNQ